MAKLSLTFRILRKLGFNYSETEYGQVSLYRVVKQVFGNIRRKHLQSMMDWAILEPINPRRLRPILLRKIGCNVGNNVFYLETNQTCTSASIRYKRGILI